MSGVDHSTRHLKYKVHNSTYNTIRKGVEP